MTLKQVLLAAVIALAGCGGDKSEEINDELQRVEANNCCACLVDTVVSVDGYYDYCFSGAKQQCVTALLKGASILSYTKCFKQFCAGDCWFMQ